MFVSMPVIIAVAGVILLLLFLLVRRGSSDMIERQRREAARGRSHAPKPINRADEAELLAEPEIREALDGGHKIEAIKLVRERTGLGLKEAKELVEREGR